MYSNQMITVYIEVEDVNDNLPFLNISSFDFVENDDMGFRKILSIEQYVVDLDDGKNAEVSSILLRSAVDSKSMDRIAEFLEFQNEDLGEDGTLMAPRINREVVGNVITIRVDILDCAALLT